MKISAINGMSFGRALTKSEKKEFKNVITDAKQELGIDKTTATIFDFSIPTAKGDTGIGSGFSKDGAELAAFLREMCGINSIQFQPQGEISNLIRSPYSGTSFSIGMHIIDLHKLASESYGKLLSAADLKSPYMTRVKDHETVNYDNVFAPDGQEHMLEKAYLKFASLDDSHPLKTEFEEFKERNQYWLERDCLFDACAQENGTKDMRSWPERDKNVFASEPGDLERINQLKETENENGINVVDFGEFVQFIADKQQREAKEEYNSQGIEIYGDCQIGFSQKDFWAHKSAFYPHYEFGCDIGDGKYSCWSPAINLDKLDSEAGKLLYNKFDLFFKRYNGVRIDAAWQFIKPLICEPMKQGGNDVYDTNGNKLGKKIAHQPKIKENGSYIINDIILKAADNNGVTRDKVLLELLGGNSYDSLDAVKDSGASLIHITRYGGDSWGRVKYYESKGSNKYQNMKPGQYTIGPGTHDDISLIEQSETGKDRAGYLAKDLHLNKHALQSSPENLADAIKAELFTTPNQFMTLPDIMGSRRRINLPNTIEGNWSYRTGQDYERQYFENLSKGKGLNLADALSKAIKAKNGGKASRLTNRLDYFANILRQSGPMTTKEAANLDING